MYAESFSASVDYLTLQDYVDRERIGVLGICGTGSWSINAVKIDTRIKALATVSVYDMGAADREGMQNAVSFQQRQAAIVAASRQRQIEVDGGGTGYTGGMSQRITANSNEIDREFFDFYRTSRGEYTAEGSAPTLTTYPTLSSAMKLIDYYPLEGLDILHPRPVLFNVREGKCPRLRQIVAQRRGLDHSTKVN